MTVFVIIFTIFTHTSSNRFIAWYDERKPFAHTIRYNCPKRSDFFILCEKLMSVLQEINT